MRSRPKKSYPIDIRAHQAVRFVFQEMERQHMHVKDVAHRLGVTQQALYNWRDGIRDPSIATVETALNSFGYTLTVGKIEKMEKVEPS